MLIVDAHEDIAYNALRYNRNYASSALNIRRSERNSPNMHENGLACLGHDEWLSGRIGIIFATLFSPPYSHYSGDSAKMYYQNSDQAHKLAHNQLDYYLHMEEKDDFQIIRNLSELEFVITSWDETNNRKPVIGLVLLMEGADPIRSPGEVEYWHKNGVRIIGPAWAGTNYCGGTGDPGPLTNLGEELLENMADIQMILDLSHMSERSFDQAIENYEGVVIASHANPRFAANLSTPERLLTDLQIRKLVERDGGIGVVPYNKFLKTGWNKSDDKTTVPIRRLAEMIDYICQLTGSCQHVGIGSDFDGGFGAESIPFPMDTIADLVLIGDEIATLGYNRREVTSFMSENWLQVLRRGIPT